VVKQDPTRSRTLVVAALGVVLLGPAFAGAAASRYQCEPQPLARIAAGTRIVDRSPEGWTHLIFKTHNQLASGDIDSLPEFARSMSQFLFTAMTARVAPVGSGEARRFRLETVAIGLGTRVGEHDMVISSETQKALGADLGIFKGIVLSKAEQHLKEVRQMVASETMMLVDAPTVLFDGKGNRTVVFRYLFLVEPSNGGLASVVWQIDRAADGTYRGVAGKAVLVQANLVATSPIHVDGNKMTYGIPGPEAFAITRLPPGRVFPLPTRVQSVAGIPRLSSENAATLESEIRRALESLRSR